MRNVSIGAAILGAACAAYCADLPQGLQARDIDGDGTVDAYYSPGNNVTYAADVNWGGTLGIAGPWPNPYANEPLGAMGWADAVSFAAGFDFHGVTGWHLPRFTYPAEACTPQDNATWGEECLAAIYAAPTEIRYLTDFSPFRNLTRGYWEETLYFDPTRGGAWRSRMTGGDELSIFPFFAWIVREGDVPNVTPIPIPEPSTYALMALGIAALAVRLRRAESGAGL